MAKRIELQHARSVLFAPGDNPRKIEKALASDADAVVLDLEDAVRPQDKDAARERVRHALFERGSRSVAVRINADSEADLRMVDAVRPDAVVVPKCASSVVARIGAQLDGLALVALIETAEGLATLDEIASRPEVVALALGSLDLSIALGLERRPDGQELLLARSQLVLASAVVRLRPPFDTVYAKFHDLEGFEQEASLARSLGLGGKLCIHPAQVSVANEVFAPRREEVAWAERVLVAAEGSVDETDGVAVVDESMVDEPVVERARQLLGRARVFERRS
jgi:citrate lyase subunit beta/citryl-CoA lyase